MKKILGIFLVSFLFVSLTVNSSYIQPPCQQAVCYLDYTIIDCMMDGSGGLCADVNYPSPPSCYVPCPYCNVIMPKNK
jgi:hypothetical protein